jgi:hypothetical protein
MSKGVSDQITYKPYDQGQAYLIPPSVDELIPVNLLARLVNEVLDEMGIERLLRKYQRDGGASRYHPAVMISWTRGQKRAAKAKELTVASIRMSVRGNNRIRAIPQEGMRSPAVIRYDGVSQGCLSFGYNRQSFLPNYAFSIPASASLFIIASLCAICAEKYLKIIEKNKQIWYNTIKGGER